MRRIGMRRIFVVLVVAALWLLPAATAPATAQTFRTADEAWVVSAVNRTRASKGLGTLEVVPGLVGLAREQSVRMEQRGSIFHNLDLKSGLTTAGLDWRWAGENVGVGGDVRVIEDAFLASPAHYDNIVRPNYTAIGVGVLPDRDGTGVYVTQVFAELSTGTVGPPSVTPAPTIPPPSPAPRDTPEPTLAPTPVPSQAPSPTPGLRLPNALEGGLTALATSTDSAGRVTGGGRAVDAFEAVRQLARRLLDLIPFVGGP